MYTLHPVGANCYKRNASLKVLATNQKSANENRVTFFLRRLKQRQCCDQFSFCRETVTIVSVFAVYGIVASIFITTPRTLASQAEQHSSLTCGDTRVRTERLRYATSQGGYSEKLTTVTRFFAA